MAITVTATPTGAKGAILRILVLTGATAAGGASAGPAGNTGGHVSVTPNGSNSFIAWANNNEGNNGAFTSLANNTILDNIAGTNGTRMATGYYSGTVTSGSAVSAGATGASSPTTTSAYEILASGGSTPSIDASSPAVADETSGSAALTSASFSPPGGAVVVAILTASNFPSAWTISDSSSMTWTKRVDNGDGQQIWTATTSGSTPVSDSDTGSGADTATLAAAVSDGDTGSGADTATLAATASDGDTAAGVDTATVGVPVSDSDTGSGADTATVAAALAGADTGAGVDTASVAAAVTGTDTASGADTGGTGQISAADAATGTDHATVLVPTLPFPQSPLDLAVEIDVNGWTDITSYVYARSDLSITRGRQDESTTTQPAQLTSTWDNRDARFSSKNPTGPYYPYLGRNTPVRVSVPEASTYLRIEVDNSSYAQAPDSSGLSITGDTELQLDVSLDNWRADQVLAAKWADTSNERSWLLLLNEDGTLTFAWSANGTSVITATSDASAPWPPLRRQALRVTLATSTGTVTFYTGPPGLSSPSWTQLGDPVIEGSAAVFDSTAPVQLGSATDAATEAADYAGIYGKIWGFVLLSGIGGTTEASPDWTSATAGASTLTDAQGNVWTCEGTSEISGRKFRFHGELSAVPQAWDETGGDVWCDVQAAGILRRLGQNTETLGSAFTRALPNAVGLVGYWTCEDGNTTSYGTTPATPTQFASAVQGVAAGTFTGTPSFASDTSFLCTQSLPVINKSRWHFRLPSRGADTANVMRFLCSIPSTDDTDTGILARMYTTGTIGRVDLEYGQVNSGSVQLVGYDQGGNQLFASGFVNLVVGGMNGFPVWLSIELQKSGSNVSYTAVALQPGATVGEQISPGTVAGSVGNATQLVIDGNLTNALQGTAAGQITYQSQWQSLFDFAAQLNAWQGEAAGIRFQRLCGEENIPFRAVGSLDDTIAMGAQTPLALTDLLQECVDADRGAIYEPREAVALGYRTRSSMQNQSAGVTLDYSQAQLAQPVGVTEDDQYTKNDVAITRAYAPGGGTGSSYQAVLETGALSIQPPPDGVGDYPDSETINLDLDSQLPDSAGWILWLGTVDDPRYPQIQVDLTRQELLADSGLWYGVQDLDLDDRLVVTNSPAWLPPDGITQLANGVTETLNAFKYTISWCCVPELPYETGIVGDSTYGRIGTDGSLLHANYTYGASTLQVDTQAGTPTYYWTTDPDDCPFDILVSGMRLTVLSVSGSSNPQTFTVVPGVNGVQKNLATGDAVSPFTPMIFSPGELGASGGASLTPIYINAFTVHTASGSENAVPGKVYIVDTTGGTVTMQLPASATAAPGAAIVVKNPSGANDVILKPVSGETVNGLPNAHISGGVHLSQGGQGRWIMPAPGGWESY